MGSIVYLEPFERWQIVKENLDARALLVQVGEIDDYYTDPIEIWISSKIYNKIKDGTYKVVFKRRYIGVFSGEVKIIEWEF